MRPDEVFEELQRIYPVSRETFRKLENYVDRLLEWQRKTNLIAPSTIDEIWSRHIADSLQCVALFPEVEDWIDVGSGGGLPGMVINAVISETPDAKITMIESIQKKCSFLRQVNRQIDGCAVIVCDRIESVAKQTPVPEIVTARALTSLPKLLELTYPWLGNGAAGLFHKGRDFEVEIRDCDGLWTFDLVQHDSKIEAGSVLLQISNLKRIS